MSPEAAGCGHGRAPTPAPLTSAPLSRQGDGDDGGVIEDRGQSPRTEQGWGGVQTLSPAPSTPLSISLKPLSTFGPKSLIWSTQKTKIPIFKVVPRTE